MRTLTLCLALGSALALVSDFGVQAQDAGGADRNKSLNALTDFDPSVLKGFIERPLFSPTRAVALPVQQSFEAVQPQVETFNFRLIGVVDTPRGLVARVADAETGGAQSLRVGESYREWTAVSIGRSELRLERHGTRMDLAVFAGRPQSGIDPAEPFAAASDAAEAQSIDTNRAVRIVPGVTTAPQWTEKDTIDVFGKRNASE